MSHLTSMPLLAMPILYLYRPSPLSQPPPQMLNRCCHGESAMVGITHVCVTLLYTHLCLRPASIWPAKFAPRQFVSESTFSFMKAPVKTAPCRLELRRRTCAARVCSTPCQIDARRYYKVIMIHQLHSDLIGDIHQDSLLSYD